MPAAPANPSKPLF